MKFFLNLGLNYATKLGACSSADLSKIDNLRSSQIYLQLNA